MAKKKNIDPVVYDEYGNILTGQEVANQQNTQTQRQTRGALTDSYGNYVPAQTQAAQQARQQAAQQSIRQQSGGYYDSYGNYVQTPSQRQAETTAYQAQKGVPAPNQRQYNADAYGNFGNWSIAGGDPMSVQAIMHDGRIMQSSSGSNQRKTPDDPTKTDDGDGDGDNGGGGTGSGSSGEPKTQEQRATLGRSDVALGTPGQFQGTDLYNQYAARGVIGNYDPATDAAYQEALAALRNAEANMPGYNNPYGDDLAGIYQKIVGREPFSYDLDADMLYQQYRQQYQTLGQNAMRDTMGQAAALTGGYGSTYAQGAGQQAYNAYLQQLNDRIPELEERAYQRWLGEGDQLQQQYAMARDMNQDAYNQYRDQMSDWMNNRSYAANQLDASYGRGVDSWNREQALNSEQANRDYQQWASGYQINSDAWDRAVQQYQLDNAANETAYSRQQDEQAKLLQLMQIGYQPTEDDLRAAGMTTAELDAWTNYIAKQNAKGSPSPDDDDSEPTLDEYYQTLVEMQQNGEIASDEEKYALYQQEALRRQKRDGTKPKTSNFALWSAAGGGM